MTLDTELAEQRAAVEAAVTAALQAITSFEEVGREISVAEVRQTPAQVTLLNGEWRRFTDLTDFLGTVTTDAAQLGSEGVQATLSGTGAQVTQETFTQFVTGLAGLSTGTTSTGQCGIRFLNIPLFYFHDVPFRFSALELKPSADSDGTNTFTIYSGLRSFAPGAPTAGIYFTANKNAHTNFQAVTNNAGTKTTTDTGVSCAVAAATPHLLTVEILANTNIANFYIDGVLVATHDTNLPADLTALAAGVEIVKSAGTTARIAYVDLMSLHSADTRAPGLT